MLNITIVSIQLILLLIRLTMIVSHCDISSAINIQSATYRHSLILRVQPLDTLGHDTSKHSNVITHQVMVREVLKISTSTPSAYHVKVDDLIVIRIDTDVFFHDICWQLLRISTINVILFLNQTNNNEFDLNYPPVESTYRVRQNIDAVLNHDTYPPQILIKTRLDKAILSQDYSIQCNSRGNPLPRLLWSKKADRNETLEYFPSSKQCKTSCRIYSVQNKYQSILYFQRLSLDDIGIYNCYAENPMNHTTTSVYLNIHNSSKINLTCEYLKNCNGHGKCIFIDNQWKCLCENNFFGEQCETNYGDIIKDQDSAILLFKSRFLAGFILSFIGFLLLALALLSWALARYNLKQREQIKKKLTVVTSVNKPLIPPKIEVNPTKEVKSTKETKEINGTIPSTSSTEKTDKMPKVTSTSIPIQTPSVNDKMFPSTNPIVQRTWTRESSTTTDDDYNSDYSNSVYASYIRNYQTLPPVPTRIDEEYEERFSLSMNKSEELGLSYLVNGLANNELNISNFSENVLQEKPPTDIIKPLDIQKNPTERYTKYVSSYSKFVLPRPIKSSLPLSPKYQQ